MSKFNLQLKQSLKKQIEKERAGNKTDMRLLNYYDLKDDEKMKVLLIPDADGNLWHKFSKHGPNLNVPSVGSVNCAYKSNNQQCPACQKGFDLLNLTKETGDESYKTEAKRWFARDYTMVQVVVLDSPVEINESPDGNQVKLMYLPFAIENIIKESVLEGIVDEDEITMTPLVIKKTKNQGGRPAYNNSYFDRRPVSDNDLSFFDELMVEPYRFEEVDLIPAPSSSDDVQEWLTKAEETVANASNDNSQGSSSNASQGKSGDASGIKDRINQSRSSVQSTEEAQEEQKYEAQEEQKHEATSTPESTGEEEKPRGSKLRDRLRASRS